MTWVILSFVAAFGQALTWALKKKSLENKNLNNRLGVIGYLTAGILLTTIWLATNATVPTITEKVLLAWFVVVLVNVVANWCAYKALDHAGIAQLMPFVAVTAIFIVPLEYLTLHVLPNLYQLIGIVILVCGVLLFAGAQLPQKTSRAAALLFCITLFCFSISSTGTAILVTETQNPWFASATMHFGISLCFLILFFMSKEYKHFAAIYRLPQLHTAIKVMIVVGVVMAFLENGPIFLALETGTAAEVFSIKRTMPLFALLLGYLWFKESIKLRHILGTLIMVVGAIVIIWFKN